MQKSILYKGLVYVGDTPFATTIKLEQTGPMQLTIRAGTYTHPDGKVFTLANDEVIDVVSNPLLYTTYRVELGLLNGVFSVRAYGWFEGDRAPANPANWQRLSWFIFDSIVPAGTADLSSVDIYVLKIVLGTIQTPNEIHI